MRLALNGATTMKANLATDIAAARAAGFSDLEIWAPKLRSYLKENTVTQLHGLFEDNSIKPLSINSIEHVTFRSDEDYAQKKQECAELSFLASALDCPYVVVVPGKLPAEEVRREQVVEESVRVLNEFADIADQHGVSIGFEFLGQTDCSVQDLALADEIVRSVDRSNVGLIIDSFHFYAGGSTFASLESIDPKRLYIFHINDAEDLPREQLQDSHRLLPGLGILPLPAMLRAFDHIGYDSVASVEIFRPEYWDLDPFELALEARQALEKVLRGGHHTQTPGLNA